MKRQNVRTLSLIVCTLTYLLVGAAVFDALESDNELEQRALVAKLRSRLTVKYNISDADFDVLESVVVRAIPHKAGYQWKFSGAFFYCVTVITTIGYGHSTPGTVAGKLFCMFYALAGIPLGLVMFQSIGERMNTFAAAVLRALKRCCGRRPHVTHIDLILVASGGGCLIIALGALVFSRYEHWTYFDAGYYAFISLTTIGFGDYVALQKGGALQELPEYVFFTVVFILMGLTLISASMNLLVLRFLTMNTEDERRDKQEEQLAARGLVRIPVGRPGGGGGGPLGAAPVSGGGGLSRLAAELSSGGGAADTTSLFKSPDLDQPPLATVSGVADAPWLHSETASQASCSCYQLAAFSEGASGPAIGSGLRQRCMSVAPTSFAKSGGGGRKTNTGQPLP